MEAKQDKQPFKPILKYLRVTLQAENTLLHQFALNENFLRTLFKELRYRVQELEDLDALSYVFYVLLPNNTKTTKGRRPFSISLKRSSPKCLELMLEMLLLDPTGKDFMRYV